jgi:hypothetical protein
MTGMRVENYMIRKTATFLCCTDYFLAKTGNRMVFLVQAIISLSEYETTYFLSPDRTKDNQKRQQNKAYR